MKIALFSSAFFLRCFVRSIAFLQSSNDIQIFAPSEVAGSLSDINNVCAYEFLPPNECIAKCDILLVEDNGIIDKNVIESIAGKALCLNKQIYILSNNTHMQTTAESKISHGNSSKKILLIGTGMRTELFAWEILLRIILSKMGIQSYGNLANDYFSTLEMVGLSFFHKDIFIDSKQKNKSDVVITSINGEDWDNNAKQRGIISKTKPDLIIITVAPNLGGFTKLERLIKKVYDTSDIVFLVSDYISYYDENGSLKTVLQLPSQKNKDTYKSFITIEDMVLSNKLSKQIDYYLYNSSSEP